ncbi:hypothetical protein [Nocardioides xinjiangensis]|uniref:hypothetical protein n=1 Tax=Nocardioides xinjiangensis TaxID=2817376 RepID=UPI001B301E97|nr:MULTISPECIES: hypothetical protein [unclassified Nocardioides]
MEGTSPGRQAAVRELLAAAEVFAELAWAQEVRRDQSRPGTGPHHRHAHSATLWHSAERTLRTRAAELQLGERGISDLEVGATR